MGTVSPQDWGRGSSWAPGAETGPALREAVGRWQRVQPGSGRGALNSRPHPNYGILDQLGNRTGLSETTAGWAVCSPAHLCAAPPTPAAPPIPSYLIPPLATSGCPEAGSSPDWANWRPLKGLGSGCRGLAPQLGWYLGSPRTKPRSDCRGSCATEKSGCCGGAETREREGAVSTLHSAQLGGFLLLVTITQSQQVHLPPGSARRGCP